MIGSRLSHYEIQEELGRGGMGIVYKAADTKLGRTVAIKVLPPNAIASSSDRDRFYREARAAATLHHPNIASIFAIDEAVPSNAGPGSAPSAFIAMEYIDGRALSEIIAEGPLKLDLAVEIGVQIAAALEAAHSENIVHRDVKSSNVMMTSKGVAKVLDFGLAKTDASTILTQEGTTVGTIAYMSPEQARAEAVDHRTDVWALGVVLYEMVVGRRPFEGTYDQALIYSILNTDPEPLSALRTGVPLELERIILKALEKDPDKRYRHVDELGQDIKNLDVESGSRSSQARVVAPPEDSKKSPSRGWMVAALMAAVAIWALAQPSASDKTVTRTSILLPPDQQLEIQGRSYPLAISPDGSSIVYVARVEGTPQLFIRDMDEFEPRLLPGTEGARYPFFSPDGQNVGFMAAGMLKRTTVNGGRPVDVAEVEELGRGATWGSNGLIVFSTGYSGLMKVAATGGEPELLATLEAGDIRYNFPRFILDTEWVIFSGANRDQGGIMGVVSSETGEIKAVQYSDGRTSEPFNFSGSSLNAQVISGGTLLYGHAWGLWKADLDLESFDLLSVPQSILDPIFESANGGAVFYSVSEKGHLVFVPGGQQHTLVSVDRQGREAVLFDEPNRYRFPRLSPDGEKLVATIDKDPDPSEVWVLDLVRGTKSKITSENHNLTPVWSPDGSRIAYSKSADLVMRDPVPGSPITILADAPIAEYLASWSRATNEVFYVVDAAGVRDIWARHVHPDSVPRPVINTPAFENDARISPDGNWILYMSTQTGRDEIYLQPYPGLTRLYAVSTNGGSEPNWTKGGREIVYREADRMMAVPVSFDPDPILGIPEILFEKPYDRRHRNTDYDVSEDGEVFVMIRLDEKATPTGFNVVQNWVTELE